MHSERQHAARCSTITSWQVVKSRLVWDNAHSYSQMYLQATIHAPCSQTLSTYELHIATAILYGHTKWAKKVGTLFLHSRFFFSMHHSSRSYIATLCGHINSDGPLFSFPIITVLYSMYPPPSPYPTPSLITTCVRVGAVISEGEWKQGLGPESVYQIIMLESVQNIYTKQEIGAF